MDCVHSQVKWEHRHGRMLSYCTNCGTIMTIEEDDKSDETIPSIYKQPNKKSPTNY